MKQQIEIKFGNRKRKFTFGVFLIGELLERKEFDDYDDLLTKSATNPFKYASVLMFESLKNTYDKYKKELDFTEVDTQNWVDKDYFENQGNGFVLFVQTFLGTNENKTPSETIEVNIKDSAKKTVPKKK
jgi:hypothetical protein